MSELFFKIILFILLNSLICSCQNINSNITLENQKGIVEVAGALVNVVSAVVSKDPFDIIGSVFGIFSLFSTDPFDEIIRKLDEILRKLDEISSQLNNLVTTVICTSLEQDNRNNIRVKLNNLKDLLITYFKSTDKPNIKGRILQACSDPSDGINKIYSFIKDADNEAIRYMQNCGHYTSDAIEKWSKSVEYMAALFVFVVAGCEQVYDYKTDFNLNRFADEIKNSVAYYNYQGFPGAFSRDSGPFGLRESVKNVVKNRDFAPERYSKELKEKYKFFNWDVITYLDGRSYHETYGSGTLCGSIAFVKELAKSYDVLVGWCYTDELNNNYIQLEGHNRADPKGSIENTKNKNPGMQFNYLLAVNFDWGAAYGFGGFKYVFDRNVEIFAAQRRDVDLPKVNLSPLSIIFPSGTNYTPNQIRTVNLSTGTALLYEKLRFTNHFNQYAGISESECWRNCISLEKCVAVIYLDGGCCYDPPVTCWLYTKDYVLNRDTANWKVYSKRPL